MWRQNLEKQRQFKLFWQTAEEIKALKTLCLRKVKTLRVSVFLSVKLILSIFFCHTLNNHVLQ